METKDIAGPTLNDVEPTEPIDPADDTTYWVGAMTGYEDLRSNPATIDQVPQTAAATPVI
jgi:hypothetical protein